MSLYVCMYVYMHPDHGFLHYNRFVKLDDSDSELEDLKEFLGLETSIYDTPRHGYNAREILQITLGETPSSSLCTMKPCGVRTFASFIVDLDRVPLWNLHADDNGAWATSSPCQKYVVEKEGDKVISAKVLSDCSEDDSDSVVTIYRQYGIHKGTHEFRRIIV